MFERILVAVDGSDHANNAIEVAADLARHYKSELHLTHTPEIPAESFVVGTSAMVIPATEKAIHQAGDEVLERAAKLAQSLRIKPASVHLSNGGAAQEILARAKAVDADLIVTGRRGLGSVRSLMLGSVSQTVSKDAECAVLTVK